MRKEFEMGITRFQQVFFTALLMLAVFLMVGLCTTYADKTPTYTLTQTQVKIIKSQLTNSGYDTMVRYKCDDVVAEFVATGKWTDAWCSHQYRRLNFG